MDHYDVYCALNKVTKKNKYPIPLAPNLFDRLSKVKYFTKVNLRSRNWQVRIAKKKKKAKTTLMTQYGSYEFLVIPFEPTNALVTFYNLMNDVLFDILDSFVVVYLDDIVIYNQTPQDHLVHLGKAL